MLSLTHTHTHMRAHIESEVVNYPLSPQGTRFYLQPDKQQPQEEIIYLPVTPKRRVDFFWKTLDTASRRLT